ncbi:MAG TPA: serine/threonine-protein kinase [Ktedonobacterales bacterium]|nr:serine/threonine-protein kinase [Ktedonobacterales bacterium]
MGPGTEGPEALIGRELAGYRLDSVLGMGATGAVFLGRRAAEEGDGKTAEVAIKILLLPWQMTADERGTFRKRFVREAETLQQMRHSNIVSVLDFGEQDGLTYMILPYLSGGTLATRLSLGSRPLPEADRYVTQIASALDYAHSLGVIHRDIKPQNVLLDAEGNAHLSDFSIARLLEESRTKLTSTSRMLGTPAYIAPEQITTGQVSAASDIYSLGAMLFELVTGHAPFEADSLMEMLRKQSQDMPPLPRAFRPDLPEPAEAVIWQALAKQPGERFTSASEMARAFSDGLNGQWDSSVRPIAFAAPAFSTPNSLQWTNTVPPVSWSSQSPIQPRRRRSTAPAWLAVIALVIIAALVLSRNGGLGAFLAGLTSGTPTAGLTQSNGSDNGSDNGDGSTPTNGSKPGKPTATPRHHSNPVVQPTTPPGQPTYTPLPTYTPTPTPTATPTPKPVPPQLNATTRYDLCGGHGGPPYYFPGIQLDNPMATTVHWIVLWNKDSSGSPQLSPSSGNIPPGGEQIITFQGTQGPPAPYEIIEDVDFYSEYDNNGVIPIIVNPGGTYKNQMEYSAC